MIDPDFLKDPTYRKLEENSQQKFDKKIQKTIQKKKHTRRSSFMNLRAFKDQNVLRSEHNI